MKKALLFVIGLMLTSTLLAGPVGKEEAKAKALTFLGGKVGTAEGRAKAPLQQELSLASTGDAYHVFNIGSDGGFVIVSASDLTPDIIGYTDEGAFDANNIPDNMKAWLQGYADQIAWVEKNGEQVVESKVRKAPAGVKSAIAPLIQTKWNQTSPYNGMVPSGCVTGCVATAMAQMLYYCANQPSFPKGTTKEIPSYTDGNGHDVGACSVTTFDWADMQLTYSGSESTAQKNAVATLMKYCGASVNMRYGSTSSATTMYVAEALNNYFGYDHHLKNVYRDQYSSTGWEDLMYDEIASGRPVLYGGKSSSSGHAFICDGYSEDGYFHINWGWGGLHDGYYLLSVVNPEKGGAGSGSAVDGYSMIQDAIIGFQAPTDDKTEEEVLLTVRALSYTGAASIANTETYYPIEFKVDVKSNLTFTHTIDFALGFYDDEDNLVATSNLFYIDCPPSGQFAGDEDLNFNFTKLTPGKTYKVKPICRKRTTSSWFKCVGADDYYLTAVTGASTTTLSTVNPAINLTASEVKLTTDGLANTVQTITAKIKNNGTFPYRSNLYLFVSGTKVSGNGVTIEPGESVIATFSYEPTSTGAPVLKITTDEAGTKPVTIEGGYSVTITTGGDNTPTLTFSSLTDAFNLVTVSGVKKFLGKKAKGTIKVTNSTGTNYVGKVCVVIRNNDTGVRIEEDKPLIVKAGKTVDVPFEYALDNASQSYYGWITYIHSNVWENVSSSATAAYKVAEAITTITADGTETETLATDTYTVPAGAVVVDMRELSTIPTTINENGNPNCLYLFASSATVPASLSDNNVVKGTTADNIVLTNGYDFYTPIDFTATNISYTRRFTTGADGSQKGWNTIVLPFDVATVKQGSTDLDWFKSSSDTGKNFWVYQFVVDGKGTVNFDYASSIKANTPYLITVPSNKWGDEFDLRDKDITFSATNVTIKANNKNTQSGFYYMFTGGSQKQSVAVGEGYVLNAEGSKFKKVEGSALDVPAFQAYFYPSSHNLQSDALAISFVDNSEVTGIQAVDGEEPAAGNSEGWYTLQGVKLEGKPSQKGIYIYNGKKVMVQ